MCTVLLPLGGYPIAVNKYINININSIHYIHISQHSSVSRVNVHRLQNRVSAHSRQNNYSLP